MGKSTPQLLIWAVMVLMLGMALSGTRASGQDLAPLEEDGLPRPGGNERIVTGTLRGPEGPAVGVSVFLDVRNMAFRRPDLRLETRTDAAGRFRFSLEDFRASRIGLDLRAHSPRYRYFNRIVEIEDVEIPYNFDVTLEAGVLARGRVVDELGAPLANVVITHQIMPIINSAADGKWEVFGLGSPRDFLQFGLDGYVREQLAVTTEAPGVYEGFEIVLRSARSLTGVVSNRSGQPVPGAALRLYDGDRHITARGDDQGRFEFKALPAGRDGFRLLTQAVGYLPSERTIGGEEIADGLAVTLDPGIVLTGLLTLPSGRLAPGTRVIASSGDRTLEGMSDPAGRWQVGPFHPREEIQLIALPTASERGWGIADLLLRQAPGTQGSYAGDVALWPQGHSSDFVGTWDGSRVRLERRDEGSTGFPSVVVYEAPWDGQASSMRGTLEVTDFEQRGTFTMNRQTHLDRGLGGMWEIREEVEASGLQAAAIQRSVATGVLPGRLRMDLTLDVPLRLAGRVLRDNDRPFLDGSVILTDWDGTPFLRLEAPIQVDGRFEFPRLPRGTFTLMAFDAERENAAGPVILRGGIEDAVLRAGAPADDPMDE